MVSWSVRSADTVFDRSMQDFEFRVLHAQRQFVDDQGSEILEDSTFPFAELARFVVDDTESAQRLAVRRAQGRACVEADLQPVGDQRIPGEARVGGWHPAPQTRRLREWHARKKRCPVGFRKWGGRPKP